MSKETIEFLNQNTLIGNTDERGTAWHNRAGVFMADGRDNHYPGAIPVGDVETRLFNWDAIDAPISVALPADMDSATGIDSDGNPIRMELVGDRKAIVRSDTGKVLGIFKLSYVSHQPREWFLHQMSNLVGDTLVISSAGQLREGAQVWVEISIPETMHNARTGYSYRPNLLGFTSFDGSLATTFSRTITAVVCDNTLAAAARENGETVKIRHSSRSMGRITEMREALSLIEQTGEAFGAELDHLATVSVSDREWFAFLDAWQGELPEDKGQSRTIAARKRDELTSMYRNDRRVSDWTGTALGVVQAANTWMTHTATVKGSTRADRNVSRALSGDVDRFDHEVMASLELVLSSS